MRQVTLLPNVVAAALAGAMLFIGALDSAAKSFECPYPYRLLGTYCIDVNMGKPVRCEDRCATCFELRARHDEDWRFLGDDSHCSDCRAHPGFICIECAKSVSCLSGPNPQQFKRIPNVNVPTGQGGGIGQ